jgi:hypothetical protein
LVIISSRFLASISYILILVLLAAQIVQPALAAPTVSGHISAPYLVFTGRSFEVRMSISNYGNSPAYYAKVRLNVPQGFSARNLEVYVGDLRPGSSKTLSWQVTAPSYATSGSFSAQVFYSDNAAGKGTMSVVYIPGPTVLVYSPTKYKVTFIIQASMPIKYAWVVVYDTNAGQTVAGGAGRATTSTQSTIFITLDLPIGNYKASASAVISTPRGPANAVGWRYFSVSGDTSVLIIVVWI